MKKTMQRAKSFIAFDFPLQLDAISAQFTNPYVLSKQNTRLEPTVYPKAGTGGFLATARIEAFGMILITATITTLPFNTNWSALVPVVFVVACF